MPIPCYLVQSVAHASSFREKSRWRVLVAALARFRFSCANGVTA